MTLVTKARLGHWLVLVVRFPVTRIVLAGLLVIGAFNVVQVLLGELHRALGLGPLRPDALSFAVSVALAVHFAYVGYVRLVERRAAAELSLAGALPELGRGVLVGIALLAGTAAAIAALGHYHVGAVNPWTALVPPFAIALWVAYLEEIVFRGILFRIIEESLGTWLALAISTAVFGLVHLANPNATYFAALAIGLEAGVLLGTAYVLTRRLWLAIGIHFAWNFTQSGIFGSNVSGISVGGLIESRLSGPDLISGGALGMEGSVFAIALCLAAGVVFLMQAHRAGHFIRPFWRRNN